MVKNIVFDDLGPRKLSLVGSDLGQFCNDQGAARLIILVFFKTGIIIKRER